MTARATTQEEYEERKAKRDALYAVLGGNSESFAGDDTCAALRWILADYPELLPPEPKRRDVTMGMRRYRLNKEGTGYEVTGGIRWIPSLVTIEGVRALWEILPENQPNEGET